VPAEVAVLRRERELGEVVGRAYGRGIDAVLGQECAVSGDARGDLVEQRDRALGRVAAGEEPVERCREERAVGVDCPLRPALVDEPLWRGRRPPGGADRG
jgi:hypothetical protein